MAAVLYLCLSVIFGYALCRICFPRLARFAEQDFDGNLISLSPFFLLIPAWFYFGVIPLTWLVYILAVCFQDAKHPLLPANAIAISVFLLFTAVLLRKSEPKRRFDLKSPRNWLSRIGSWEYIGVLLAGIFTSFLVIWVFHIQNGVLSIGYSVFSDFTPHVSMIRSFSRGINFPACYTPFAGEDVKYHFLYMFLCGNLEYLGLRLDVAFNLPTILGFLCTLSLLYTFGTRLSGRKAAGGLAVLFFLFRSSPSLWTYLAEIPKGSLLHDVIHQDEFIGYTPNENWGLWNLNVYLNQRHLAFILGILILFVMFFAQTLWDGLKRLEKIRAEKYKNYNSAVDMEAAGAIETSDIDNNIDINIDDSADDTGDATEHVDDSADDIDNSMNHIDDDADDIDDSADHADDINNNNNNNNNIDTPETLGVWLKSWIICFFRESVFSWDGWRPVCPDTLAGAGNHEIISRLILPVCAGLYLGMISFWNGAVLIAALLVLFILALFSDARLSYLITAVISLALALIQSRAFIWESAFSLRYFFGFIAENKTLFGVIYYIWLLTGFLLILVPALFAAADGRRRCLLCAFSAPFLFAFTISLTIDPTVNHKYIMISLALILILAAEFLADLFVKSRKFLERVFAVLLCLCLTATGVFESYIIYNRDKSAVRISMDDPVTEWIMKNTGRGDIFLTSNYSLNNVVISGAECFQIWQYFAWSAGYDTLRRDQVVAAVYGAESPEELSRLISENRIAYIIIDDDNRRSAEYELHENIIASACEEAFRSDDRNLIIYQTPSARTGR